MGVVYKLKDEVKNFIISQKQQNPKLGCRKLVDMVNKRFSISASKSSINSIIKEAGLSSRVGRPKYQNGLRSAAKQESHILPRHEQSLLIEKKEDVQSLEETPPPIKPAEVVSNIEEEKVEKAIPAEDIIPLIEPEEKKELEVQEPLAPIPEIKEPEIKKPDVSASQEKIEQIAEEDAPKLEEPKETELEPEPEPEREPEPEPEDIKEPPAQIDQQPPVEETDVKPPVEEIDLPKEIEKPDPALEQLQETPESDSAEQEISEAELDQEAAEEIEQVRQEKEDIVIPEQEVEEQKPILEPKAKEDLQPEPAAILSSEKAEEEKEIEPPVQEEEIQVLVPEEPIIPVKISDDEEIDSVGTFFLKAAEWEVFNANTFDGILRGPLQNKSYAAKTDSLIYHSVFGINDLKEIDLYKGKGLWLLNDSLGKFSSSDLQSFMQNLMAKKEVALALHDHIAKGFSQINKIKYILNDNSVFLIDGQWKTIWSGSNIPAVVNTSISTTKHYIERTFVNNSSPINIFNISGFKEFSKITFEFLALCEDTIEKRIKSVIALSPKEEELYREDVPSALKRNFIIGFWPWQAQAKSFQPFDTKAIKTFVIEELGRQIFYSNFKVDFPKLSVTHRVTFRVIFLRDSEFSSPRIGILTNISEEKSSPEEIIRKYVMRWPNLEETYQDLLKKQDPFTMHNFMLKQKTDLVEEKKDDYQLNCSTTDAKENIKFLLSRLHNYAVNHYFPFSYKGMDLLKMKEQFYSLPGKVRRINDMLIVSLLPAKDYALRNDLLYAIRRVNESGIRDNNSSRLFFKIG